MAAPRKSIPDAELEVLKVLWAKEPQTVREITAAIYGSLSTSSVGTVQTLIQRLENKRYVKRDRSQYVHRFSARVSQADVAGSQLEMLAQKVCEGSLAPFISHLVQAKRLSREEKDQIRRLLED